MATKNAVTAPIAPSPADAKRMMDMQKQEEEDANKIMGMPKAVFFIGLSVLLLGGGFVAYKLITKKEIIMETTNFELMDDNFSNVTAKKSLAQLTGCKKPTVAGRVALGVLTLGIGDLATKKKHKAKVKAYNDCLNAYKTKVEASKDAVAQAELKTAQASEPPPTPEELKMAKDMADSTSDDGKIMGMPKVVFYIGVGVLVLVGGFIAYKVVTRKK